jgi:alpha-amylase
MKVVVDIVTNHLGQLFYYDINMNGQPDDRVAGGTGGKSPSVT